MPSWFTHSVRVRMEETDALGVVYYGRYLAYFDLVRLEMLRSAGVTAEFLARRKLGFVAAEATCKYRESAKFDDLLSLRASVEKMGSASITYSHEIRRGTTIIALGRVTDVLVKLGRPVPIPGEIRERLAKFGR